MVNAIAVGFINENETSQTIANDLPNVQRYSLEGADVSVSHENNEAIVVVTPMTGRGIIIRLK